MHDVRGPSGNPSVASSVFRPCAKPSNLLYAYSRFDYYIRETILDIWLKTCEGGFCFPICPVLIITPFFI